MPKQNRKKQAVGSLKQAMNKEFKDWYLIRNALEMKNIRNTEYYTDLMDRYKSSHWCELQEK